MTKPTIVKRRVYVDNPSEAPDDVNVQSGNLGGTYYETETSSETISSENLNEGETVNIGDTEAEVFEVWSDGALNLLTDEGLQIVEVNDGKFNTDKEITDDDGNPITPESSDKEFVPPEKLSSAETDISQAFEIDTVNLSGVDESMVSDILSQASDNNTIPDVQAVSTNIDDLEAKIEGDADAVALWNFISRELYLNPDTFDDDTAQSANEQNWLVSDDAEGMLHHEIGHARTYANNSPSDVLGQEFESDEAEVAFNEVSKMAATSPHEFVAEVYSGLMTDKNWSDDVMELYYEMGGVEV